MHDEAQLAQVYAIWASIAREESLPEPQMRVEAELDSAETTLHLLVVSAGNVPMAAARLVNVEQNARIDRVCVLGKYRGLGVGRAIVEKLLAAAASVRGAVYVDATRGEMGFFSIMGFESLGNDFMEGGVGKRTMVYRTPVCALSMGCVGLHHTSIRVGDIERTLAFYGSLSFVVTEKFVTSGGRRACYVEGLGTRLEFVEAADGRGGLEGVQGVPPAGFDRLVFDVTKACTDLELFLQHLERRNGGLLEICGMPSRQIVGGSVISVASVTDPDGLPIQFIRWEAQVPGELRTRVTW